MAVRVQVILQQDEKARIEREARRVCVSLSAWIRRAATDRVRSRAARDDLRDQNRLRAFFRDCAARQKREGREPDWEQHKAVLARSMVSGSSGT